MKPSTKSNALIFLVMLLSSSVSAFAPQSILQVSTTRKTAQFNKNDSKMIKQFQIQSTSSDTATQLYSTFGFDSVDISSLSSTLLTTTTTVPLPMSFLLNVSLFVLLKSKLSKLLTPEGFYHSLALGTMLWHTLGWQGWTTCVLYLGLGSLVTKVKFKEKEEKGIAEGRGGRRGPENVWGSAATGLICAALSAQLPNLGFLNQFLSYDLLILAYVSSLATKLADTFASEIGKAYGKTTFLITTLERVEPGTEGAISLEGTVAAAVGGSLLPIYATLIGFMNGGIVSIGIATLAAFLATNAESLIGATLQGKKGFEWMTNEVVNFLNTVIGAAIAIGVGKMLI